MSILDIRGTHGSGKSWLVHKLLETYDHDDIEGENGDLLGYLLTAVDTAVIGRYEQTCGGCDGIRTADEIVQRVKDFSAHYRHVVLEGILVAHTFGRYHSLAMELADRDYRFLFLNTPMNVCISRVRARREQAGNPKKLDPTNLVRDWNCIWDRVRHKCLDAGHKVTVLDYRDPMPKVIEILSQGHE